MAIDQAILDKGNAEDANNTANQIAAGGTATATITTPPPAPNITTIGNTNLATTPPATVPPATSSTSSVAGAGVTGTAAGVNDSTQSLIDSQNKDIASATTDVATQKSAVQTLIDKLAGKGDATVAAESAAGIPDLTKSLQDVTNEYNTKSLAFKHQQEAILADTGLTREQANQNVAELSRVHNQELADIAIRQSVASGNLTAAQTLVNHKIDLQYGDLKDLISYQQKFLDNNEARLSTAQQNKLQLQITDNTRKYTEGVAQTKALEDQKLETLKAMQANNAPQSAQAEVQAQKTPEGVIATAGKYGVSLQDQQAKANIAKIYQEIKAATPSGAYVLGSNPTVDGWVQNINSGKAKLSDVPAAFKSAVSQGLASSGSSTSTILETTKSSLKELQDMVDNNKGFQTAVGVPDLLTHPVNFTEALFTGSQGSQIAGTDAANFVAKYKQVVNDVVLPNLTVLHGLGRVTDREFQALQSSITSLGTNQSESAFKTELKNITDQVNKLNTTAPAAGKTTRAQGPDGKMYDVPNDQIDAFVKAGGKKI